MKKIRDFMNKYPLLYAVIGLALLWGTIRVCRINAGALTQGVNEIKALILVLLVYWLLSGRKQDLKPDFTGFSYGFRVMRLVYIFSIFICVGGGITLLLQIFTGKAEESIGIKMLNYLLIGASVGAVEEFTCRAMLFGGLVRAFKSTRKGVIWAAVVSGILFGFIHVAAEVFTGEANSTVMALQVVLKTVEAGVFGVAMALIYFETRSIWTCAALHSLFDFLILAGTLCTGSSLQSYVAKDTSNGIAGVGMYVFLSLLTLPAVVRGIRALKQEPEPYICPGDEDFVPRKLTFVKKKKKKD